MDKPVSMQDILTGAVELPDTFQVDTHMGDPNAAEVPRPDLVERYLSDEGKAKSELMKENLEKIRLDNARWERDTGSPEVQSTSLARSEHPHTRALSLFGPSPCMERWMLTLPSSSLCYFVANLPGPKPVHLPPIRSRPVDGEDPDDVPRAPASAQEGPAQPPGALQVALSQEANAQVPPQERLPALHRTRPKTRTQGHLQQPRSQKVIRPSELRP
mmetsp:Transcript_9619/g.24620  ORF Transcript_9619/g.24620 Transcript_9619/m.24620 type:complete len:216 (+) Transcript_9619:181-828(+)